MLSTSPPDDDDIRHLSLTAAAAQAGGSARVRGTVSAADEREKEVVEEEEVGVVDPFPFSNNSTLQSQMPRQVFLSSAFYTLEKRETSKHKLSTKYKYNFTVSSFLLPGGARGVRVGRDSRRISFIQIRFFQTKTYASFCKKKICEGKNRRLFSVCLLLRIEEEEEEEAELIRFVLLS